MHVALSALGIGPGDEVIVPSYTFIASSFSIVQAGAIPRFADVNLDDHCISVESAEKLVTKRTKAIMPVHLYGNVCDMDAILAFAKKHNLFVIEDNAEAFGGSYKGKKTGTLGHMAGCSFCQNKTFTTGGEGGMVTTDDEELAWQARSFRDHGYDVKERLNLLALEQKLPYIHNRVGWNYRMTEMQSAIGLAELERMDIWNMPRAGATGSILLDALGGAAAGQVHAHRHARAAERLVRLRVLARHREHGLRHPAVRGGRGRRRCARAGRCSGRNATPRRRSRSIRASATPASRSRRRNTPTPPAPTTRTWTCPTPAGTRRTPSPASPSRCTPSRT